MQIIAIANLRSMDDKLFFELYANNLRTISSSKTKIEIPNPISNRLEYFPTTQSFSLRQPCFDDFYRYWQTRTHCCSWCVLGAQTRGT